MKRQHRLRAVLITVAAVILLGLGTVHAAAQFRLEQARAGLGAVSEPSMPTAIVNSSGADGKLTAHAEYTSIAAEPGATVESDFTWDDDWFFQDSTVYNHDLARACSVLSAVAISESEYYQQGSSSPAYMENLLAQLGFEEISTASYKYRSEVIDEFANVFQSKGTDVTAYSIASKHIEDSQTGQKKLLLVVSVRGSYGSEWLSNLRMGLSYSLGQATDVAEGDHEGFSTAALEIYDAVFDYLGKIGEQTGEYVDYGDVVLLFTGHSRGAATANLTAAYFDDLAAQMSQMGAGDEYQGFYVRPQSVYAYCLATPELSMNSRCHDGQFNNIFNILNPSDIVPRLPLSAWGYNRYGCDLWLPEPGCEGFDQKYGQFKADFAQDMHCESKYAPADAQAVDDITGKIAGIAPGLDDFRTPLGIVRSLGAIATGGDIVRILQGHAPNTYIAWLNVTGASDLRASR